MITALTPKQLIATVCTAVGLVFLASAAFVVWQGSSSSVAAPPEGVQPGAGPNPNFDHPFVDGVELSSVEEAGAHLSFAPVVPASMRPGATVYVHDPATVDKADQAIGLVITTPAAGRFLATEEPTTATTESLENLIANCTPDAGCEANLKLIDLPTSAGNAPQKAMLIDGPESTGVIWIRDGHRFDVFGPPSTFLQQRAIAVATAFSLTAA
jgi:hypothetical protein